MGHLLAEPVTPVFCSDVCSSTYSRAENLQWCTNRQNLSRRKSAASSAGTASSFRSRDDVPNEKLSCLSCRKAVVYLPPQTSCWKPAVAYLLAQSFVPKISVACLPVQLLLPEAALAFSIEQESPAEKLSEPLMLEGWSGLSTGSTGTVGRFQWSMYWPSLSSRKDSVAYLKTLPLVWGLVWRIDWQRLFCQKGVVGWVRPRVSVQAHNHFSYQ